MTPKQVQEQTDALVKRFNGAIKYAPILQDRAGALGGKEQSAEELQELQDSLFAAAKVLHDNCIANLRIELAQEQYAGKKPEEIQKLLTTETVVDPGGGIPAYTQRSPLSRIWGGIPYTRNIPTLENIAEAQE